MRDQEKCLPVRTEEEIQTSPPDGGWRAWLCGGVPSTQHLRINHYSN